MNLEIYKCPEPWKSKSKFFSKKINFIIGIILIIIGILLYAILPSDIFYLIFPIDIIIIFIGSYLSVYYFYLYKYNKDTWILELPPNEVLFKKINIKIEEMLKSKKYNYKKIHETIYGQKGSLEMKRHPGVMDFIIKLKNIPNFIVNTELRATGHDLARSENSFLTIANVRPENLPHVINMLNNIKIILDDLDYKSY
jgi:hypothetical protein